MSREDVCRCGIIGTLKKPAFETVLQTTIRPNRDMEENEMENEKDKTRWLYQNERGA